MIRLTLLVLFLLGSSTLAADRPNVVWVVSEDNSIHYLDHFFPGGADTPNIKKLAAHGLTFDHTFSNAPVCSVARTTLATMCYGPRVGTQFHRKFTPAHLPEGQGSFYQAINAAGYYTTNQSKEDFNYISGVKAPRFDKGSWRDRPEKSQPFFHMESHTDSHEGKLQFSAETYAKVKTSHDPASVTLADYHPDTPLFRYTHAHYLDRISVIDGIVGKVVAKLEEDGLLEDTFIFYFGDHGGVLPRGKGYAYESGLHVPLVVRVPKNFRHLVEGAELGSRRKGFVSFIDFGPTVLQLAGAEVPAGIDGRPFLGAGIEPAEVEARNQVFGHADRMDEKYDFVRSIRRGKYQYLRVHQPHHADGLQNNYRYKMLAYQEWRDLFNKRQLVENPAASAFFLPRPPELLYDCEADPHQVTNLADDPAHRQTLESLRAELQTQTRALPDLSFYPESHLSEHAMQDPVGFGERHAADIARYATIADLALLPLQKARPDLLTAFTSEDPFDRYWGAMAAMPFAVDLVDDVAFLEAASQLLEDDSLVVRIRAAELLGEAAYIDPQETLTKVVNASTNPIEITEALQAVVHFHDKPAGAGRFEAEVDQFKPQVSNDGVDRRIGYLNGDPEGWKKKRRANKK